MAEDALRVLFRAAPLQVVSALKSNVWANVALSVCEECEKCLFRASIAVVL